MQKKRELICMKNLLAVILTLVSLIFSALAASDTTTTAPEQKPFKIYAIFWYKDEVLIQGFMDYLKRKNIPVEYIIRMCDQDRKKCHALIPEIREMKPDLIFAQGTSVCEEIAGKINSKNKSDYILNIPIMGLVITDPVGAGLIHSLEKPGRNLTGVNHVAPVSSHLEVIKSYLSSVKNIAALYNPAETNSEIMVKNIIAVSKNYDVKITRYPIPLDQNKKPIASEIEQVIAQIAKDGTDFIYMPSDSFLGINIQSVSAAAIKYKIPTFGTTGSMYITGHPLIGFFSRFYNVGLLAGFKAEQILINKKKPEEIPYETQKTFSLLLAPDTFQQIKIYPPLEMLKYAEIVS